MLSGSSSAIDSRMQVIMSKATWEGRIGGIIEKTGYNPITSPTRLLCQARKAKGQERLFNGVLGDVGGVGQGFWIQIFWGEFCPSELHFLR